MTWLFLLLALWAPVRLAGQPTVSQDSAALVLERARDAQRSFESARRRLLPLGYGGGGRCDERIGRFCYWYDDRDTTLPEEPPAMVELRARFLDRLDEFHHALPHDEWILGQQVRYLVEHRSHQRALELTGQCHPSSWWCAALEGFVLHDAERFGAADRAFERALAAMPEALRCEWTDLSEVLDADLLERIKGKSCRDRQPTSDSILWLADPLLSQPGNDLATELLSRRVVAEYFRDARSPHGLPFGKDIADLALRYGWSIRWSRADQRWPTAEQPSVIGHSRTPAYAFFPQPLDDQPFWRYRLSRDRPRSRYAPSYAGRFSDMVGYRVARFPRGDTMRLVLVGQAPDSIASDPRARPLAVFSSGPKATSLILPVDLGRPAVAMTTPATPGLAGIEIGVERHWARARWLVTPIPADDSLVLSDPLLFAPGERLPGSLDQAVASAVPSARLSRARPVGVYWEVSGPASDSLEISIGLIPERRGLLGRIGQSLALVKRKAPLTLRWAQAGPASGPRSRAIELNLAELRPGHYTLELTLTGTNGVIRATHLAIELTT